MSSTGDRDRREWIVGIFGELPPEAVDGMDVSAGEQLLIDLPGFDSLRFLEIQIAVEALAGEDLPDLLLSELRTVEDCLATIASARARHARVGGVWIADDGK